MKTTLYAITDRRLMGDDPIGRASRLLLSGVGWLQVREKDLPDADLFMFLSALASLAKGSGARLLLSGRPDLALAAGATGVHLPASGLPTHRVRALCPPPFLVVRSCHSLEQAQRAQAGGADAVTLGPVYPTPSKVSLGNPMGIEAFSEACRSLEIPVLGLGGIGAAEAPSVIGAGASGIAGIRLFWSMASPEEEVPALRRAAGA